MKYWYVELVKRSSVDLGVSEWNGVVDEIDMYKISNGDIWWVTTQVEVMRDNFEAVKDHQINVQFSIYE